MSSPEEPAAKRVKVEAASPSKDDMADAIFRSWDRDDSGALDFEEIIPHFMKSISHQEKQETQVREQFTKFMESRGADPKVGMKPELFRSWLCRLDEDKVRTHYERHVLGVSDGKYDMNINKAVDKAFEGKSLKEILDAPTSAIQGISDKGAEALAEVGVKTVRDLGQWRFYLMARAIVTLAEKEDPVKPPQSRLMNIRSAMDRSYETMSLKGILKLRPSAFNMFPDEVDGVLEAHLNIKTIESLGSRKVFAWANAMVELEKYEAPAKA